MKQITGIEPASSAWEADVLPMNYACKFMETMLIISLNFRKVKAFSTQNKTHKKGWRRIL